MKIEIKVDEKQEDLNSAILQRIRRTINVMCDMDFEVELTFKEDKHPAKDFIPMPKTFQPLGYY